MAAPVENISDTARWVAVYRAMETERPDAHFRDPHARELAGERGEQILRSMRGARGQAWAFVVRTCSIDDLLLRAVPRLGLDAVVNLAAGLDTRPYRLPLPETLKWIEVDLPGILSYKAQRLAGARPVCPVESVALDLADVGARRELFRRVGAAGKNVLVISEGLLVYLTPEQVGSLAADLHAEASFRGWILDIASPDLLKLLQRRYGKDLANAGAPLKFGPAEGTEFFRPHGWKTVEFLSTLEQAQRLGREMPMAWLFRLFLRFASEEKREKYRRFGGVALLERA